MTASQDVRKLFKNNPKTTLLTFNFMQRQPRHKENRRKFSKNNLLEGKTLFLGIMRLVKIMQRRISNDSTMILRFR